MVERVQNLGFSCDDYAEIRFTQIQKSYTVGTNANAALANSWISGEPAKNLLFYATEDCWIRFNDPSAVQHFIPANTFMRFRRRCYVIYVVRSTADGKLRVWMEG